MKIENLQQFIGKTIKDIKIVKASDYEDIIVNDTINDNYRQDDGIRFLFTDETFIDIHPQDHDNFEAYLEIFNMDCNRIEIY